MCREVCIEKWKPCNGSCSHDDNLHLCGDICTESPCSSCHAGSGPDTGSPCIFPFIWKEKTHMSCVTDKKKGKKWCSTQVDSSGVHIKGNFGYCNEDCNPTVTRPDICTEDQGVYMCGEDCIEKWKPCDGICLFDDNLHLCEEDCFEKWQPCNCSCYHDDKMDPIS